MDEAVLTIDHLNRRFGSTLANDDVSLHVKPGEVVGLLGHNGAGKTTLVSQIVGLVRRPRRPDHGSGRSMPSPHLRRPGGTWPCSPKPRRRLDGLTPRMAIEISARIRGASVREACGAAAELAEELDIGPWLDTKAQPEGAGLSGGVRRLTAFAMALAKPTPLLIFDEPTNDVDASRRRLLWDAVRRRGDRGCGVLLVTHNVAEAERVVDRLVVLRPGAGPRLRDAGPAARNRCRSPASGAAASALRHLRPGYSADAGPAEPGGHRRSAADDGP